MKLIKIFLSILLVLPFIVPADALAADDATESMALFTRAVILAERTQIVISTLGLSDEEIEAFSPVYLNYWEEMNVINDKLEGLVLEYAESYENLSDEKALSMLDTDL